MGFGVPESVTYESLEDTATAAAISDLDQRLQKKKNKIDELKASGEADSKTIEKLKKEIADLEAEAKRVAERAKAKKRQERERAAAAMAAAQEAPTLSPLAYGVGGAAAGALVATFLGRGVVEGLAIGAIAGGGYAYLRGQ